MALNAVLPLSCDMSAPAIQRFLSQVGLGMPDLARPVRDALNALNGAKLGELVLEFPGLKLIGDEVDASSLGDEKAALYERNLLTHKGRDYLLVFYAIQVARPRRMITILPRRLTSDSGELISEVHPLGWSS
jgi:hypothetical protein